MTKQMRYKLILFAGQLFFLYPQPSLDVHQPVSPETLRRRRAAEENPGPLSRRRRRNPSSTTTSSSTTTLSSTTPATLDDSGYSSLNSSLNPTGRPLSPETATRRANHAQRIGLDQVPLVDLDSQDYILAEL